MSISSKIALIEDSLEIKDMYKIKLELGGYRVVTAGNGIDALKLIKNEKPDLILLDILIPRKDGFEVLEELKNSKDKTISTIPVIIITNLSNKNDQCEAERLGAADFLVKTKINPNFVLKRVNDLLKNNI